MWSLIVNIDKKGNRTKNKLWTIVRYNNPDRISTNNKNYLQSIFYFISWLIKGVSMVKHFTSQIIKVLKNAYNTPLNTYQLSALVLIIGKCETQNEHW